MSSKVTEIMLILQKEKTAKLGEYNTQPVSLNTPTLLRQKFSSFRALSSSKVKEPIDELEQCVGTTPTDRKQKILLRQPTEEESK